MFVLQISIHFSSLYSHGDTERNLSIEFTVQCAASGLQATDREPVFYPARYIVLGLARRAHHGNGRVVRIQICLRLSVHFDVNIHSIRHTDLQITSCSFSGHDNGDGKRHLSLEAAGKRTGAGPQSSKLEPML